MKLYRVMYSSWVYTKNDLIDVIEGDILLGTGNYEMPKTFHPNGPNDEKYVEVIAAGGLIGFSYRKHLVQIV